jgi:hypothetical protein
VDQFKDHRWYESIRRTHDRLEELIPGYAISQIKEKFGRLRYYFAYPAIIPTREKWPAYSTVEKIKTLVEMQIIYAEGWIEGYEKARSGGAEATQNNP